MAKFKSISLLILFALSCNSMFSQGNVVVDADTALNQRMNSRIQKRLSGGKIPAYKFIIYSGKSKTVAMNVRSRFRKNFRDYSNIDLIWDEPRYKVLGGFFFNKFNAQRLRYDLEKENFPTVILTYQMFRFPKIPLAYEIED